MKFEAINLQTFDGVGPALGKALVERFGSWEALAEAEKESLTSMKGMRTSAADDLIEAAKNITSATSIPEEYKLDEGVPDVINKTPGDSEKEYVLQEIRVDKNTVLRNYVERTPAVCVHCGFDVIQKWGLQPYDQLPPSEQARVRQGLKDHIRFMHSQERVISAEQHQARLVGRKFGAVGLTEASA